MNCSLFICTILHDIKWWFWMPLVNNYFTYIYIFSVVMWWFFFSTGFCCLPLTSSRGSHYLIQTCMLSFFLVWLVNFSNLVCYMEYAYSYLSVCMFIFFHLLYYAFREFSDIQEVFYFSICITWTKEVAMFNERYFDLMKQYARRHMVSWSINLKANM